MGDQSIELPQAKKSEPLDVEWVDVSHVEYREYIYSDRHLLINNPVRLHVSSSGGHRIIAADGTSYYIAPGWLGIKWRGDPLYVV